MTTDEQIKAHMKAIKKVLLDKHKGYKTVGAVTGGALGAGLGGTIGLVKTINKHRKGELDELDIKEYLKSVGSGAGIGLGAGSLVGLGAGEYGRRWSIKDPIQNTLKTLREDIAPENITAAGEFIRNNYDQTIPKMDLAKNVKKRIMYMLSKKAPPLNTVTHNGVRAIPRTEHRYKASDSPSGDTRKYLDFKQ
jgi:hypothetical protein